VPRQKSPGNKINAKRLRRYCKKIYKIFASVTVLWRLEATNQRNMRWLKLNEEGKKWYKTLSHDFTAYNKR
jgi:hypothetical protein